jgi:hypothetical protein
MSRCSSQLQWLEFALNRPGLKIKLPLFWTTLLRFICVLLGSFSLLPLAVRSSCPYMTSYVPNRSFHSAIIDVQVSAITSCVTADENNNGTGFRHVPTKTSAGEDKGTETSPELRQWAIGWGINPNKWIKHSHDVRLGASGINLLISLIIVWLIFRNLTCYFMLSVAVLSN